MTNYAKGLAWLAWHGPLLLVTFGVGLCCAAIIIALGWIDETRAKPWAAGAVWAILVLALGL